MEYEDSKQALAKRIAAQLNPIWNGHGVIVDPVSDIKVIELAQWEKNAAEDASAPACPEGDGWTVAGSLLYYVRWWNLHDRAGKAWF